MDIKFLKDFKFTANFTLDNVYRHDTNYQNNEYGYGAQVNGWIQKYSKHAFQYNTQQLLNYNKNVNDIHAIDVMIGHEFSKTDDNSIEAYKHPRAGQRYHSRRQRIYFVAQYHRAGGLLHACELYL